MREKFKGFVQSKKFQFTALILLLVVLSSLITYIISYTMLINSKKSVVMIETNYNFPILVDSRDELQGKELINKHGYKDNISHVISKIVKKGNTCIDIGAGFGYHTILMAKLSQNGKIFSFEPIPDTFKLLRNSINMNGFADTKVFDSLLSAANTKAYLEAYPNYFTVSSVLLNSRKAKEKGDHLIEKDAYTLDYLLPKVSNVTLMKIDTNGSELAVIKGAASVISRSPKLSIILSYNARKFAEQGDSYPKLIDNFINAKFEFWLINPDGSLSLLTRDQLMTLENADVLITKVEIG